MIEVVLQLAARVTPGTQLLVIGHHEGRLQGLVLNSHEHGPDRGREIRSVGLAIGKEYVFLNVQPHADSGELVQQ